MLSMDHSIDDLPYHKLGAFCVADLMAGFVERVLEENAQDQRQPSAGSDCCDGSGFIDLGMFPEPDARPCIGCDKCNKQIAD